MKTLIFLFCLVAGLSAYTNSMGGLLKKIECDICFDIIKDTEKWIGKGEQTEEKTILTRCAKFFEWFKAKDMEKRFCDKLLKNGLSDIIKRMENKGQEDKDAAAVCGDLHACPQC